MRSITLLAACATLLSQAQYQGPESVEYDPAGDRYFVSTTTGASIKVRDQAGTVTNFVNVSPAPYGLEIMGDTLFACSGGSVKGYLLSDATQVFNRNLGGTFLNGIATDGQFLYVTDFSQARIYKVDVANNSHTTLVSNTSGTPNGIVHLPGTDELLVAFWGTNAPVKSFDRNTGALGATVATSLGNIDGIAIDCLGRVLLASWSPDRISAFEWGIVSPTIVDLGIAGLNNPADIDFDAVSSRVCIPNAGNNTVVVPEISCNSAVAESEGREALRAIPNPTDGLIRFDPPFERPEPYLLLDSRGLLIGGGTISARAYLDVRSLEPGNYVIDFTRAARQVRFVRE